MLVDPSPSCRPPYHTHSLPAPAKETLIQIEGLNGEMCYEIIGIVLAT